MPLRKRVWQERDEYGGSRQLRKLACDVDHTMRYGGQLLLYTVFSTVRAKEYSLPWLPIYCFLGGLLNPIHTNVSPGEGQLVWSVCFARERLS